MIGIWGPRKVDELLRDFEALMAGLVATVAALQATCWVL